MSYKPSSMRSISDITHKDITYKETDMFGIDLDEYTEQSEDDIFGDENKDVGFGTNAIIQAIRKFTSQRNPPIYDCFLININTLIRNVVTKEKDIEEIKNDTLRDLGTLVTTICDYFNSISMLTDQPYIVIYFPKYEVAQIKFHERKYNRGSVKDIINEVSKQLIKEENLEVRKQIRDIHDEIPVFELLVGNGGILPYRALERFIYDQKKFNPAGIKSILRRNILISHYPLDYYFMHIFQRTVIMESFTGNIVHKEDLGLKVFNNNKVPFNKITHLVFGDVVQLRPMAKGRRGPNNNRKILMDLALKQNWNIRTPSEIANLIGQTGQIPKEILLNINF